MLVLPQVARVLRRTLAFTAWIACCELVAACGSSGPLQPRAGYGIVGSSIAVRGDEVLVVNPDQGSVSILDANTLVQKSMVDVGGEPHALLVRRDGVVVVANYRGGELVTIEGGAVRARRRVCDGPYGLAESPDASFLAVSCEWDGTALRVDPETLEGRVVAENVVRPRALVAHGDELLIAEYTGGRIRRVSASGEASLSLVPTHAPYRPAITAMSAHLVSAFTPAFGSLYVTHELVNHEGETAAETVDDDYGSVRDGHPKINAALTELRADGAPSDAPVLYSGSAGAGGARIDAAPRIFNAPSAAAAFRDRYLLVTHISSADVAMIDTRATDPERRVTATVAVGAGPMGVAVDEARGIAYVDNAFDASVTRIDLSSGGTFTLVRPLPQRYSAAALAGRKIFHDATNRHVTPSGVVACSTCHPGGGDDGLVWFMHTSRIPLKRRRTPHLGNAHAPTAPFHWDGAFSTMDDLVRYTVIDLMAGDGLLLDTGAVRAYIDEMVQPPLPPPRDAAAVERGRVLFESTETQCAQCHAGPDRTDRQRHDVLDALHDDDRFTSADTPSLRGLFLRAPYFHDGRSPDLHDLLTRGDAVRHGHTGALTPSQMDDLIDYLESL